MADGKVKQFNYASVWEAALLTAQEGNTSGTWYCAAGLLPISFSITGISGDTVQLRGSNDPTIPSTAENGHLLNSSFTTDTLAVLDSPVKWVKAIVTNWNAGIINVYAIGYYKK